MLFSKLFLYSQKYHYSFSKYHDIILRLYHPSLITTKAYYLLTRQNLKTFDISSKKSDGKKNNNIPWLVYNLPQDPHCIVVTHIFKIDVIHLGGEGIMRHKKKVYLDS